MILPCTSLVQLGDLAAHLGQFRTGHVEDVPTRIDAAGDVLGERAEILDRGQERDQLAMAFRQPHAKAIHVAGAGQGCRQLEQLLGREHGPDGRSPHQQTHVGQPGKGRRLTFAEHDDHLGDQVEFGANAVDIGARLDLPAQVAAQSAEGVPGQRLRTFENSSSCSV